MNDENFAQLLFDVSRRLGETAAFSEAIRFWLEKVCGHTGWEAGHAYIMGPDGQAGSSGIWHFAESRNPCPLSEKSGDSAFAGPDEWIMGRVAPAHRAAWHTCSPSDPVPAARIAFEAGLNTRIAFPVLDRDGVTGVMEFFASLDEPPAPDVLDRVTALAALLCKAMESAQQGEKIRIATMVINNTMEGVILTDKDGLIEFTNPSFTALTGFTAEEARGKNPSILQSGRQEPDFYRRMWGELTVNGFWEGEVCNRRKNGEVYQEHLMIVALRDDEGKTSNYVGMFHDITELKRTKEEADYQFFHDTLTGLPNRQLFLDRLKSALARAAREKKIAAVIFIDLDGFKSVNDSLGHSAGDLALRGAAMRLVGCLRDVDTVSRPGGDEFAIILENLKSEDDAAAITRKTLKTLSEPYLFDGEDITITACAGVTCFPADGDTPETLLKNAERAMLRARERGRGQYRMFQPSMNERAEKRFSLENAIRNGIDRGEFLSYFQPKMDAHQNAIVGLEALVRWRNGERGIVPPAEFIPLAEETGLIAAIDELVIFESCEFLKKLHDRGYNNISVSVNISAMQFDNQNLYRIIRSTLDVTGLDPKRLCLEITESSMMKNIDTAIETLVKLKNLGVGISLDDFGTGYSSLSHLRKLPIDELKIDMSFVRSIPTDPDSSTIASIIVNMAHVLGLRVIAEGVERKDQLDYLVNAGCRDIQGFLVSPPLPPEELESFLLSSTPFIH